MDRALAWLRNVINTVGLIVRQAVLSFRNNWGIGLLSVVLALSLWVYVTDRENPQQTGRVPGTVAIAVVNVPPGQAILSISPMSVTVTARAPESVLERLRAEDFRATVDLSDMRGQQATVDVDVESTESRTEVVDISPQQITVTLENVVSRTVPVQTQLDGTPPRGFELREITVEPEEAVVTGPESLVGGVETVEINVSLTGVRSDFEQTLPLQARNAGGGNIEGVQVQPESALVRVEIVQLEFSIVLVVQPEVSGVPAEGYNVTALRADPATILVTGPLDVLQSIDLEQGLLTEAVSIEGATADVVQAVSLQLPQGASVDQSTVTVRVSIGPAQGQFSFDVIPQVTNLAPGLIATLTPPTVRVVLQGAVPDLRAIEPGDIRTTLDLSDLGVGEHAVPVGVQAPHGTTLLSIAPAEVSVTIASP